MKTLGVVLAGGRSSRMGTDKALLKLNQLTMLERAITLLSHTSVEHVVVSRNSNRNHEVSDLIKGKGPLSGIHSVAHRYMHHNLLILPVDMPLMSAETLENMLDHGRANNTNTTVAGQTMPMYLVNNKHTRFVLDYTLRCTNQYSVERFCRQFPLSFASGRSPQIGEQFLNTNTPEEWQQVNDMHLVTAQLDFKELANGTC